MKFKKAHIKAGQAVTQAKPGKRKSINTVAYVIIDKREVAGEAKAFYELEVRNSATAWWMDRQRLELYIQARKIQANDKDACYFAGIWPKDMQYFLEVHPHFSPYFDSLKGHRRLLALSTVDKNLHQVDVAFKALSVDDPETYGAKSKLDIDVHQDVTITLLKKMRIEDLEKMEKDLICPPTISSSKGS